MLRQRIIKSCLNNAAFILLFLSLSQSLYSFDKLRGICVPISRIGQVKWLPFIAPNEVSPREFGLSPSASREKEELVVAVGSFRALQTYALRNCRYLLMADIDRRVTEFNNRHLRMIEEIASTYSTPQAQRLAYILAWHGCAWSKQHIEDFDQDFSLSELKNSLLKSGCNRNAHKILNHEAAFHLALRNHTTRESLFGYLGIDDDSHYWNSDQLWQKLTDALAEKDIAISRLDIVDEIPALMEFSEAAHLPINTLDVSNTASFVFAPISKKEWAAIIKSSGLHVDTVMYTYPEACSLVYKSGSLDDYVQFLERE